MPIVRNSDGAITNAEDLTVDEVIRELVLCPACRDKVFQVWPEGWDAHAEYKCSGVLGGTEEKRKAEFKNRFSYLFR